jgi:outer membrane protein OmpA-like peptidoglycan-associated protein
MRQNLLIALLGVMVLVSGCATKGYVRKTVDPVNTKVDQVTDQANKTNTELAQTRQDVAKNTTAIQATDEKATAADRHVADAMTKANEADSKAVQANAQLGQLRQAIANIDDYKVMNQETVLFKFNRATLTPEDKMKLDAFISNTANMKRYFIAVEGYADPTGDAAYNLELSKRRAEAVVQYLVGEKDVDFNRIHIIGLGEQKLADTGTGADARANNRRVELKIYGVEPTVAAQGGGSSQ